MKSPGFKGSESPSEHYNKSNQKSRIERYDSMNSKEIFRSVCISNIPVNTSEGRITDIVAKKFTEFGKYILSITKYNGERVAYVNFINPSHAHRALDTINKLEIDGKYVSMKPIFHNSFSLRRFSPSRNTSSPTRYSKSNRRTSMNENSSDHSDNNSRSQSPRMSYKDQVISRTLFVGNLNPDVTKIDIENRFGRHGEIIDIELKKPSNSSVGPGAYAFIRFPNLDIACKVKHEMEDRTFKGRQIKLGFGKAQPTQCVYISGLGAWLQFEDLEREIVRPRRVAVRRINWPRNKEFAFVICENNSEASKLVDIIENSSVLSNKVRVGYCEMSYYKREYELPPTSTNNEHTKRMSRSSGSPVTSRRGRPSRSPSRNRYKSRKRHAPSPTSSITSQQKRRSPPISSNKDRTSNNHASSNKHSTPNPSSNGSTPQQVMEKLKSLWNGRICLGNKQQFGIKLFRLRGDEAVADILFNYNNQQHKIPQPRSITITSTVSLAGTQGSQFTTGLSQQFDLLRGRNYCLLLGTAHTLPTTLLDDALRPQKPISKLVDYLNEKNCAGSAILRQSATNNQSRVSPQTNVSVGTTCVLVFPPSQFVYDMIKRKHPNLCNFTQNKVNDDFLMVLMLKDVIM